MRFISEVLYQTLMRNAPYKVREELVNATDAAVIRGQSDEARSAAEALVKVVKFQRGEM